MVQHVSKIAKKSKSARTVARAVESCMYIYIYIYICTYMERNTCVHVPVSLNMHRSKKVDVLKTIYRAKAQLSDVPAELPEAGQSL